MDEFISTHELRLRVPKELISAPVARFVPEMLLKNVPAEIKVPLAGSQVGQERGFVKKVIIPFLLGLKFKATALLPLALALIALKTWKALTLGLLSLVLSGALMMFRFATKPKILSYEVVHAHPPVIHSAPIAPHYIDHHDHIHDHHFEHPPFAKRSLENTPYSAHAQRR
uniref:Osiris 18 n=1 Tax=Cacopsylla melanoneura TaxID=428564 RepID=A0A8D8ZBE8_9HEMI